MKLYMTQQATLGNLWLGANRAKMYLCNERSHRSRYAEVEATVEFNGYGSDEVHSRRRPNDRGDTDFYAATWDQWGTLLSNLYFLDPTMKVGGYKHPYYRDADDFHMQTNDRFKRVFTLSDLDDFHGDHSWEIGMPRIQQCRKCSAMKRW